MEIRDLEAELEKLLKEEELTWKQRAHLHWMRDTDKNTKYFHAKASARKRKNTINSLVDNAGNLSSDESFISSSIWQYFNDFYAASSHNWNHEHLHSI